MRVRTRGRDLATGTGAAKLSNRGYFPAKAPTFAALLLASWFSVPGAHATEQMCKQQDVVDFVARAIRTKDAYVRIDRDTIFERPAPAANSVLCFVGTVRWEYDFTRFQRMLWAETREYLVRKLEHGYEVTILR